MLTTTMQGLRVVAVRYGDSHYAPDDERSVDAYEASGVYGEAGVPYRIVEPRMPECKRTEDEPTNLGWMNGAIADAVAAGRRQGEAILMVGGNCSHLPGVVGGLQDAHGAAARIGLVFFDAHGDFNTPRTTLSGMLGGMPVAVVAGLAHRTWREGAHIAAPIPTDRIVMVDMRHLDEAEAQLLRATDATIAAVAPQFPGADLGQAVANLASRCDLIYLHIDSDVLDGRYVPNHGTIEHNGPSMEQVLAAVDKVMATGKVVAYAVVSVYGKGEGHEVTQRSGIELVRGGLDGWADYGLPSTER